MVGLVSSILANYGSSKLEDTVEYCWRSIGCEVMNSSKNKGLDGVSCLSIMKDPRASNK